MGRVDMFLGGPHLDTRIKKCILMDLISPTLEYAGEVWEGEGKVVKKLETVQMVAAEKS